MVPVQVVKQIVDLLGQHILAAIRDGTKRFTVNEIDSLYRVLAAKLGQTSTGQYRLASLRDDPGNPNQREETAAYVSEVAQLDPGFSAALTNAAQRAGVAVQPFHTAQPSQETAYVGGGTGNTAGVVHGSGRVVGVDRSKRFHIGSLRFGTGGLATAILALSVIGGGAATIAVNAKSSTESYQQLALAACKQAHDITSESHSEILYLDINASGSPSNPTDLYHVHKDVLLRVVTDELNQVKAVFTGLDKASYPDELRSRKAAVDRALAEWSAAAQQGIQEVNSKVTDGMTGTAFQALGAGLTGPATTLSKIHLNSAMSDLAGQECTALA